MVGKLETTFPRLSHNQLFANRIWVQELGEFPCHYLSLISSFIPLPWDWNEDLMETSFDHADKDNSQWHGRATRWKEPGILSDTDEQLCPASQGHPCHISPVGLRWWSYLREMQTSTLFKSLHFGLSLLQQLRVDPDKHMSVGVAFGFHIDFRPRVFFFFLIF